MRVRTVISGIVAGAICLAGLWFQLSTNELVKLLPTWQAVFLVMHLPPWITATMLGFYGFVLFAFGWVAARWNWTDTWMTSLQAGAGAGLIAGCLIFDFFGTSWYGLQGNREILINAFNLVSEAQGNRMVIEAVTQTAYLMYINFILILCACGALSGLGGLVSSLVDRKNRWGRDPRRPEDWLFHLPAYLLVFFGCLNLLVTMAVLNPLWEKTLISATQVEHQYGIQWVVSPRDIHFLTGYIAALGFILLPIGITWGWILRAWFTRERASWWGAIWIFLTTWLGLTLLNDVARRSYRFLLIDLIVLVSSFAFGLVLGLLTQKRSEGFAYHLSDWVGFALTCGILGGTQIMAGIVAYSLALALLTIMNISHIIKGETVSSGPVEQVIRFFSLQNNVAGALIVASMIIGVAAAGLVAFFRTVFGIRNVERGQLEGKLRYKY